MIAGLTGEVFTRTAHMVLASVRPDLRDRVAVCELANGSTGYMPTIEDFALGGYEVNTSGVAPGASELAARRMIDLVNDIA